MMPTREIAEQLLQEAELCNPGPWGDHSRTAAHCAEAIARVCPEMDANKAYILGLLHDIGRKFGVRHLAHTFDGYTYMMSLGYDEVARVCITHAFNNRVMCEYIGNVDTTQEEFAFIEKYLNTVQFDEYDMLIQLCDALAAAEGVVDVASRMEDVKQRYGFYPEAKWNRNLWLKKHFEEKTGTDIYELVGKGSFCPQKAERKFTLFEGILK